MNTTHTTTSTLSFESIAAICQKLAKQEEGFFPKLSMYVQSMLPEKDVEAVRAVLKNDEAAYEKAHGFKVGSYGAYRSAKSIILKAVEVGVSLLDEKGKPLGKTALEKAIKENGADKASDKSAYEKCQIALATFRSCYAHIETPEEVKMLAHELATLLKEVSADLPKA